MTPPNELKSLLSEFSQLYRETIGEIYVPTWGRDMKLVKELLVYLPAEKLRELFKQFFAVDRKSYSLPWFKMTVNDLLRECVQKKKEAPKPKVLKNPYEERFL